MKITNERLKQLAGIHDTLAGYFSKMVGFDSEATHSVSRHRDIAAALRAVLAVRELLARLYSREQHLSGSQVMTEVRAIVGAAEGDR